MTHRNPRTKRHVTDSWLTYCRRSEPRKQDAPAGWDQIDWREHEGQVRRLRQRIFKAAQEQDWPRVRNLQKLTAPRGALSYPRLSREEFEGRFLGLMPYLELKGEGNRSMAGN